MGDVRNRKLWCLGAITGVFLLAAAAAWAAENTSKPAKIGEI